MLDTTGSALVRALVLFCVFLTVACGGGSGAQGGLPNDTCGECQPDDPTALPENDLSSMLVGLWLGNLGASDWDEKISFSADGQYQSTYLHPTDPNDDFGRWSVSGATELPDWDTPWVLTMRSDKYDESHWNRSHLIVLIDDVGFTERKWVEGSDKLVEMERVQE